MKKIFLSMLAISMAAFTFTSCEDVPEPYGIPGAGDNGSELPEGLYLNKDFSQTLDGFTQTGSNSNIAWDVDFSSACITGYKNYDDSGTKSNQAGVTWLVSDDAADLTNSQNAYVEINHALNYEKGDINANNSVLISKDYNGDVNAATWETLTYSTDGLNSSFTFVTKKMNIPESYIGAKVYVALRHTCTDTYSSTWEVKSVSVKEGTAEESETPTPPVGDNSKENPYTVAQAIANNSGSAWVKGYIVGWVEGQVLKDGAHFDNASSSTSNILIADDANETDLSKCIPVQLPTGDVRTALNLKDNPGNYKKEVVLFGSLEKYFGTAGLKTVTEFVLDGQTGGGDKPVTGEPEGDGTAANPFNAVAAYNYASSLAADTPSDIDIYVKGKVSQITFNYANDGYGNATYYISEDGTTSSTQFYVFRSLYLNNTQYTEGDVLSVGDDVVVCGKVVNYKGNTPETQQNQSYLYSWTKNGGSTGGSDDKPTGDTDGTKENPHTVAYAIANNSGTAWVKGYIVGWIDGMSISSGATFNGNATSNTNLLIADDMNETDISKCLPVQLPSGSVRSALNLQDNPGNYKKQVSLYGSLERYFGTNGFKSISEFSFE